MSLRRHIPELGSRQTRYCRCPAEGDHLRPAIWGRGSRSASSLLAPGVSSARTVNRRYAQRLKCIVLRLCILHSAPINFEITRVCCKTTQRTIHIWYGGDCIVEAV